MAPPPAPPPPPNPPPPPGPRMDAGVQTTVMVVLTVLFVTLYVLALLGVVSLKAANEQLLGRLESIVWVIIGYYFGRVPADRHEKDLKDLAKHNGDEARDAHHAAGDQRERAAAAEQKVRAAHAALSAAAPALAGPAVAHALAGGGREVVAEPALRQTVATALRILEGG